MPIDSQHPIYAASVGRWTRLRTAYEGDDAVKAGDDAYLPRISTKQTPKEYEAYKSRASFYDALSRTIDGFVGAVSRKPNEIVLPDGLEMFAEDATAEGTNLNEFIKHLCSENVLMARAGVLVDYDDTLNRAHFVSYPAESITNWGDGWVVLRETVYETGDDGFETKAIEQYRHLAVVEGVYTVTIWRERQGAVADGGGKWVVYSVATPTRRGQSIATIPWVWLSTQGCTARISKPPMLGLADLALSHYRTSADLEHGRHYSGLPTLWISGIRSDEEINVGSTAAILLEEPNAKVSYAQFDGDGLGSLERALAEKEEKMAALGAAILSQRKGVESAETTKLRSTGESSLLMGVVSAVEECIRNALAIAAEWMSIAGEIVVKINRDFVDVTIEPQMLLGMVAAYQAGTMSLEAFLYALQQGEMLPPDTDLVEEAAKLRASGPVAPATLPPQPRAAS